MTSSRLFALCLAVVAVGACGDDEGLGAPAPVAGMRFVNAVGDTGSMDIRVVDIVGNAPQFLNNTFRSFTPYQPVTAGTRRVRVFMTPSQTDTLVGAPVMWDTTFTFVAGTNYTIFMTGFARAAGGVPLQMVVLPDPAPDPGGQVSLRVINWGTNLGAIDGFTRTFATLPPGGSLLSNLAFGGIGAYTVMDTARLSLGVAATGATSPLMVAAAGPLGAAGTPNDNPIGGVLVPGSVLTAVIVPPSVVGSTAPQGGRPAARTIQVMTRSNDTVTARSGTSSRLENRLPAGPDSVVGTTGAAIGVVTGDHVQVAGAAEAGYNDWQIVLGAADSLSCNPVDPTDTPTECKATNVIATTHFRYKFRLAGAPGSPATGAPVYRIYTPTTAPDYTIPYLIYVTDRRPLMTVP
ncbi:MAG: DUF4397 domain-containing protein [Gemmatimonadales bacterium]